MNIIEAIKSGKRFRRRLNSMWGAPNFWYEALSEADIANRLSRPMWAYEDLVADDWEVEQVPIAVTEAEFDAAWDKASSINSAGQWLASFKDTLKKELGL